MFGEADETIPSVPGDYGGWHRGRSDYAVWLIRLDGDGIQQTIEAARLHMADYLLPTYGRQGHITLFVCGFLAKRRDHDDDFTEEQFRDQARLLRHAGIMPFRIEVGAMQSFASAPFLEVSDPEGGIARVRDVLTRHCQEIARDAYIPHVTIGLYSGAFPRGIVEKRMASFHAAPRSVEVGHVTFATYGASRVGGPLTYRHEVELRGPLS
ncbi:MAG: 2'-5' RNA ligase family protein [Spirochaetes bacterium]|nr:2'-5' RNA ligase family protein [Spirochaetota bacterium]